MKTLKSLFKRQILLQGALIFLLLFATNLTAYADEDLDEVVRVEPVIFGYDLFRELPEPILKGPVDDSFILSAGDEIVINVWGELNLHYVLTVSNDGYIDLPDSGGRVHTSGVTIKELRDIITERFSRIYSSYINFREPSAGTAFVDVRLGKVRNILVYVVGEVKNQGAYTISSGVATLLNLLTNAGGIKKTGSLREIRIQRHDGSVDHIDLYDFLLSGRLDSRKMRLLSGDYILVPLRKKSVKIQGEVRRSGIYEIIDKEGIKELIQLAGGLTSNAYTKRIQIRRFDMNLGERIIDLDLEALLKDRTANFMLEDSDEVTIFPNIVVRNRLVSIKGEGITRPGTYEYFEGMTLNCLIEKADGLREYVYLDRADLIRTREDFSKELRTFSLSDIYYEKAPGTYALKDTLQIDKNFALRELDEITIYSSYSLKGRDRHITISGHVKEPGSYVLADNMTLYDLIFARGGFQDDSHKRRTFLGLAHIFRKKPGELSQKVITFNLGDLLEGQPEANIPIEDGDTVVIYSYDDLEIKPTVRIGGLVKRPGQYELAEDMVLGELILKAGGLTGDAYRVEASIARVEPGTDEDRISTFVVPISNDISIVSKETGTLLRPNDRIIIRNLYQWDPLPVVTIKGEIRSPGDYTLEHREARISQLINMAGGLKSSAFIHGAYLERKTDILKMKDTKSDDRKKIVINLAEALRRPYGAYDLELKNGDRLFIPRSPGTVEVKGAVRNPGIYQYRHGRSASYYLDLAGGVKGDNNIVVFLPDGSARRTRRFLFFRRYPSILPGSIIKVPEILKVDMPPYQTLNEKGMTP